MIYECGRMGKFGNTPKPIQYDISNDGCWVCTSHAVGYPYPTIKVGTNKKMKIHRFVYEREHGTIPLGMVVRHRCDNTRCINPDHLELGTQTQNMHDMIERGRNSIIGVSKLSDEDIVAIRANATMLHREIAEMYGVSRAQISRIKSGRRSGR